MRLLNHYKITLGILLAFVVLVPTITYAGFIENTLWKIVIMVFGGLLGLCSMLLNFGINETVIGFAYNYGHSGVGEAVDSVWVVIRDFMNLAFIFGILYIGFKIILNSDDSNTRSMLARLIIAALLVNFSLFITKLTVDVSNSIASEIALNGFLTTTTNTQTYRGNNVEYVDMSGDLQARMGINGILDAGDPPDDGYWYIFGTAIFLIITSFVYAAGGILLIIRYAVLNLYMVLSPLMFIGWAFPPLAKFTSQYWEGFLKRAFFAPVYFLLVYFSLHILSGFQTSLNIGNQTSKSMGNLFGGVGGEIEQAAMSVLPFFLLTCIFMIASLVVSSKLGADGASQAVSIGKNLGNRVQRGVRRGAGAATFGAGASLGRNTLGRAAHRYGDSEFGKRFASRSWVGRTALKASDSVAGGSFDARRIGGLGKAAGIGEGKKGGYTKIVKDREKEVKDLEKRLGTTDTDTPENKLRIERETARITAEKEKEIKLKGEEIEQVKTLNERIKQGAEMMQLEISASEEMLKKFDSDIKTIEAQLKDDTLNVDDRDILTNKRESLIVDKQKYSLEIDKYKAALKTAEDRDAIKDKIAKSQAAEQEANANGDYNKVQSIRNDRSVMESKLAKIDEGLEDKEKILQYQQEDLNVDMKNAAKEATARIKYEKQIDLLKSYEKSQKTSQLMTGVAGAATLAMGASVGLPLIGAAYAASAMASTRSNTSKNEAVAALKKDYGKQLRKKLGKDDKGKLLKNLSDEIKNNDDGGDNKDGDKEKES